MTSGMPRTAEMRRQAENMFAPRSNKEIREVKEREKAATTEKQKTERLRALRLAREAEERAAAPVPPKSKARK
jgi:hypothetical protein